MAFECRLLGVVRLSIFGRFVFLESAISGRFVWDFSEIWICGLYVWMFTMLEELIMHKKVSDEIEQIITEYMIFSTTGWRELMKG